jgi:tetratricopeptide (TPR) repeat protein
VTRPAVEHGLARRLGLNAVLAVAARAPQPEVRLGRYELIRKVGAGGMGVVFRGRDPATDAPVAVKLLEHASPDLRSRFAREVGILRSLAHPQIVRYLDDGVGPEGAPYLVMEWLDGCDLARRIADGPTTVHFALQVALAAAAGLGAAHAAGVVHRDVKPANLFLVGGEAERLRVIDFGIARAERGDGRLTATGVLVGTPSYMAPEQLRGEHGVPADVWGLGVTLFEMLTGRVPFPGRDAGAVLLAATTEPLPSLVGLRPDAPRTLELLLGRMLARAPEARPQSMAAVGAELADLLGDTRPRTQGLSMREARPTPISLDATLPAATADTALFGRAAPLGRVRGLLAETLEERVCNVVLVSADAGLGRSAFLAAVRAEVAPQGPAAGRLLAIEIAAEPAFRRTPFGLLSALLVAAEAAGRAAPTLRALLAQVESGAGEAIVLADALRVAWFDVVDAWRASGPVLVFVDDAHEADLVSLRFLARAAVHLQWQPCAFVLSTRAGAPQAELAALFSGSAPTHVELPPLRPTAMHAFAASVLPQASLDERSRVVDRAAGNPAHLRALSRSDTSTVEASAGSAAALVWGDLERLDPDGRRLLRAASLIGGGFDAALLAAVLGGETRGEDLADRLSHLVLRGFLRPRTRTLFDFADELTRAGCHALLTGDDLRAGNRALAEALVARGAAPARVARHFLAGGEPGLAAPHLFRAARAALAGEDAPLLAATLEEALTHVREPGLRAELLLLSGEGAYWEGAVPRALDAAEAALALCAPGSATWLRAQSLRATSAGQLGRNAVLTEIRDAVLPLEPVDEGARDAQCICLGRLATQLGVLADADTAELRALLARRLGAGGLGPMARAWSFRGLPTLTNLHYDSAIEALTSAHDAHVEALDHRAAAQIQVYLGSYYCWIGAWARAAEVIDDAQRISRRLGAEYLELWADYALGKLQTETAPFEVAASTLTRIVERTGTSPRIRAGARIYLSLAATRAGAMEPALDAARSAFEDPAAASIRGPAVAALVRALLGAGRVEAAAALAEPLAQATGQEIIEFEFLVHLAHVELVEAMHGRAAARPALDAARAALFRRAGTLADPLRRNAFLRGPHLNARLAGADAETPRPA